MAIAEFTLPAASCGAEPVFPQYPASEVRINTRRLKVGYLCPESRRLPNLANRTSKLEPFPYLRLRGRWLERAGFEIGGRVNVRIMPRRLVIELLD